MSNDPFALSVTRLFPRAELNSGVRLAGGVPADVHRLDLNLDDGDTISLVLRVHGAAHSGHPAELEYQLLQTPHRARGPVAEPLLVDVSGSLLPDPFVVMGFVEGTSRIPAGQEDRYIDLMADVVAGIHALPTSDLPTLPTRNDPLPEVLEFLPKGSEWEDLRTYLNSLTDTAYVDSPTLLHADFWPENLLWENDAISPDHRSRQG